jgi:hypothetical protein
VGFKHDEAESWPTQFLSLFDKLKGSETILKVVILTPRPLFDSISSKPIPLIRIAPSRASSSKLPLWQRIRSAVGIAESNSAQFTLDQGHWPSQGRRKSYLADQSCETKKIYVAAVSGAFS